MVKKNPKIKKKTKKELKKEAKRGGRPVIKPIKNKDKYNKKKIAAEAAVASAIANGQPPPPLPPKKKKKNKKGGVLDQMRTKLQGGQFRWLNEQLYTSAGEKALELMNKSPELYEKYHEGFRKQTEGWPVKPVDLAIEWLKEKPETLRVADLGCGDAALAAAVPQTVHSFDLLSTVPGVVACNMAALPLEPKSVDIAVFCLSLMGTDYGEFLEEAARVLTTTGKIWIAEVQSRFMDESGKSVLDDFISAVTEMGFVLKKKETSNTHFLQLEFKGKKGRIRKSHMLQWPTLRACQYKKR